MKDFPIVCNKCGEHVWNSAAIEYNGSVYCFYCASKEPEEQEVQSMSTSPTTYDIGYLLQRMAGRQNDETAQKQCSNCRRGMYKTDHGPLQCENCELEDQDDE